MFSAGLAGFLLGGSLIVAIGAQNAFVIRQGILNQHVFWVCAFCALADAVLIWGGVFGLAAVISYLPWFVPVMTWGGVAFLLWHGVKALLRAVKPSGLSAAEQQTLPLSATLLASAGFTLLNPHVYLDTVILVGSIANARPAGEQVPFAFGASLASLVWFFSIGFGALALKDVLGRPTVWRGIDGAIALIMFALSAMLVWN